MICPSCATENLPGAKFCNECGAPMSATCPSCGATNKPGAKFCNECGTPLAGAPAQQPRSTTTTAAPAATAERRLVSVLFVDIVGFTPFAEERDAEEVRDTLSRYFELCADVISRYGGTVEKYIGDAVMAVWGAPTAHEDDAERSVRAALDLVDAVPSLGAGVKARAGVLTGEAAVTLGATNQGMVAGDLVNTAARLQSAAPEGTVLVGESTFRATSDAVVYEEAGEQLLKGKAAPVAAWRAVRIVAERGGRNRSEALEAPFIGRADELRLLKDLFHATGREQKARLVSVMGPGGIGKSRLAWEFLKYVDGLVETTYWHSGRSPSYGEGVSFWALGEMVRGRCGLVEGDDERATRQKVSAAVAEWVDDEAERQWVERGLFTLLGLESGMASQELFGAWRTFFERIADRGTVTLVFEDMHAADPGLLDFVDHMLDWSRGRPIYIVSLARPELLDRRPDWGAGKRNFTSIYLEPLSDDEMRELLAGLVPGLPKAAVDTIVARADGVPLYAVETVRTLVADGRLVQRDDGYVPTGDLNGLAVPETLMALIASRLDSLDPVERELVQDAAVLGQSFTIAALAAVGGVAVAELDRHVVTLIRREILAREIDARSAERGQLTFVQGLIREVAYNTLSKPDRKRRHLAAARYFEQLGSDELAGALAGQYLYAYRNASAGAEAEALAVQARIALSAAADRAAQLGAHVQAMAFLEQALEVASDSSDRAGLLERAGASAAAAGRTDLATSQFEEARTIYLTQGDRLAAASVSERMGEALLDDRRVTEGLATLESASAEYADLWPAEPAIEIKATLARAYNQAQRPEDALAILDDALAAAERADLLGSITRLIVAKGGALANVGRMREAIALFEGAEKLARDNDLSDILAGMLILSGFHLGEIDMRAAFGKFSEGVELARRRGQRSWVLIYINNLGYTGFLSGDWDTALQEMQAALAEDDVSRTHRTWLLGNSITILASRGEEYSELLEQMDAVLASGPMERELEVQPYDTRANVALATGDLIAAREAWRAIVAIDRTQAPASYYQAGRADLWRGDLAALKENTAGLNESGVHGPIAELRRVTLKAAVDGLEGRIAEAQAGYRAAIRGWRDAGVVLDEVMTGIDMVYALREHADPDVVASTRTILERLRARPYLARLDALLAEPTDAPRRNVPEARDAAVASEAMT